MSVRGMHVAHAVITGTTDLEIWKVTETHWAFGYPWISSTYIRSFNQVQWLDIIPVIAWRHQMETFSALLALCAGNSPVPGEFPSQRPVTRGFYVFIDLRLNKQLNKQSRGWWFETLSRSSWRHCNGYQDKVSPIYSVLDWIYELLRLGWFISPLR